MSKLLLFSLLGFMALTASTDSGGRLVAADPTARVTTQIYVTPQRVRMILSQFTDDLVWLHGMEADPQGVFSPETLREYYQLHRKFLGDSIQVIDVQGNRLTPLLVDEGPYPFDDDFLQDGATEFHLVKRTMSFTYEWASPEPLGTFTIRHAVVDDNFLYPAEMSIDLFQGESDLPLKAKLRLDVPMTIDLDWEQPVPNLDASDEEKRAWLERQDERLLGVTNFGSVYLWSYVEPRNLRVELLLPLNVLATLFEIRHSEPDFLQASELPDLDARIKQYFSAGNPVTINGAVVKPIIQRIDYFPADQRDFALRRKVERISLANGRVGVSLSYPYRSVPQEITLAWDKFGYALPSVQAYLFYGNQVQTQVFSRQLSDNRLPWDNAGVIVEPAPVEAVVVQREDLITQEKTVWQVAMPIAVALLAAVLVFFWVRFDSNWTRFLLALVVVPVAWGATQAVQSRVLDSSSPTVASASADQIAGQILPSIYRAFDFVQEEEIYAALEQNVAGSQLRRLYLQLLSDLQMEDQSGAVSRIEKIDVLKTESLEDVAAMPLALELGRDPKGVAKSSGAQFRRRIFWNLTGLVEHWGHTHQRTNQYQAVGTFLDIGGEWKLVDLEIESQTIGSSKPQPNRFAGRGVE